MSIRQLLALSLLAISFFATTLAQMTTIDAEFRPRSELRRGFKKPIADSLTENAIVLQRTRLSADYKSNSLNARLTLQDSRIWGQTDTKSSAPQTSILEGWCEMLLTSGFSVQFGRQILKYDDQRLLGAGNWSNTGNAHDAAILKYRDPNVQIHLGAAYNNTNDTLFTYRYNVASMYQSMGFLWMSAEPLRGLTCSLLGIGEGLSRNLVTSGTFRARSAADSSSTMTYGRFTYGGNCVYQNDSIPLGGSVSAFFQSGRDARMGKLNAYLIAAKGTVKISQLFSCQAGIDIFSGTSASDTAGAGTSLSHTFNKLYGTNHSFNGAMEYWSTLPSGGIMDIYLGGTWKPGSDVALDLTGHLFSLSREMTSGATLLPGKALGGETDFTLTYQWSKEVSMQTGYSRYFKSDVTTKYFAVSPSENQPQWAYLQVTVRPVFFKSPT
jgi:hypothetical protein